MTDQLSAVWCMKLGELPAIPEGNASWQVSNNTPYSAGQEVDNFLL